MTQFRTKLNKNKLLLRPPKLLQFSACALQPVSQKMFLWWRIFSSPGGKHKKSLFYGIKMPNKCVQIIICCLRLTLDTNIKIFLPTLLYDGHDLIVITSKSTSMFSDPQTYISLACRPSWVHPHKLSKHFVWV